MALIHGFVLAIINLAGLFAGFAVYHLAGSRNQIAVQVPVALLFTMPCFPAWLWMTRRTRLRWDGEMRTSVRVFVLALVWAAVVFVPLHYATQGYVTAWSNLTAMWAFQAPANLLALLLAQWLFSPRAERREDA